MHIANRQQRFPRDKQIAPSASAIMRHVAYALLPGSLLATAFFGIGVLVQLLLASLTALACEWLVSRLRRRRLDALACYSGLVTAVLLALLLPPTAPWYLSVWGVAFGLLLGKHAYGGVGMNIFNPAMVGACALYLSFAAEMGLYPAHWVGVTDSLSCIFSTPIDGVAGATALASLKASGSTVSAAAHTWLNLAWLAGGAYLWYKNLADWRLSLAFAGVFTLATLLFSLFHNTPVSVVQHLNLGALIFTTCYIITDPTTAATGRKGRLIYAALAALIAVIIRQFSHMPDSMAFSVLLANSCAPLIDNYTRPEYYRG